MSGRLLPVGAFVCLLRESLEVDPLYSDLWLEGDISDLSRSSAGHVYFSLRDDDGCLKCVLFRGQALRQPQRLRLGDRVAIHGGLSIYPRSGSLQLVTDLVRPAGLGASWLELELLRQRLEAEGLFDERRKRPLPAWPHTIGVVTSAHGAAWQDIQSVVRRRFPLATLVLSPAHVQGDGAVASIVEALEALRHEALVDVVIVARGGGANDDLAAFNDERVVRAIFASPVPVIAGVGHATDRTLTEDVADAVAPTPSAAAEICVPSRVEIEELLGNLAARLEWTVATRVGEQAEASRGLTDRLRICSPGPKIHDRQQEAIGAHDRLHDALRNGFAARRQRISTTDALLGALDPVAVLRRGYAAMQRADDGRPVFSVSRVAEGDRVVAILDDGTVSAVVEHPPSPRTFVAATAR